MPEQNILTEDKIESYLTAAGLEDTLTARKVRALLGAENYPRQLRLKAVRRTMVEFDTEARRQGYSCEHFSRIFTIAGQELALREQLKC